MMSSYNSLKKYQSTCIQRKEVVNKKQWAEIVSINDIQIENTLMMNMWLKKLHNKFSTSNRKTGKQLRQPFSSPWNYLVFNFIAWKKLNHKAYKITSTRFESQGIARPLIKKIES